MTETQTETERERERERERETEMERERDKEGERGRDREREGERDRERARERGGDSSLSAAISALAWMAILFNARRLPELLPSIPAQLSYAALTDYAQPVQVDPQH